MRILFLALDVDLSRVHGDSIHTVELARGFRESGNEVQLVVARDRGDAAAAPQTTRTTIVRGSNREVIAKLMRVVRTFRPDVVYERRTTPKISFALSLLSGTPAFLEVNGILSEELALLGRRKTLDGLDVAKSRIRGAMLRRLSGVVAISPSIKEDLVFRYRIDPSRVSVIGNGVDTGLFRPISKSEACTRTGLRVDTPRVIFVGNLAPWRRVELLPEVLDIAKRETPALELMVVGSGQLIGRIKDAVRMLSLEDSVRFVGEVPHEQVPYYVCASDVSLLPATSWQVEISPLKLWEYLACERPVVAHHVPGLEILETEHVGRTVTTGDASAFASAIQSLLGDEKERAEMGLRGRELVLREHTWIAVAKRITDFVEQRTDHFP